jgi:hypothetical protein
MSDPLFCVAPHPATIDVHALLSHCDIRAVRGSGPGGQHRNKVSTGIVIKYLPLGVSGEATERRSQAQNREVAIERLRVRLAAEVRTQGVEGAALAAFADLYGGLRLRIAESNPDYPVVLALLLDRIYYCGGDLDPAAADLKTSPSQVLRLLRAQPEILQRVNRWRVLHDRRPLR